jgi:hypothetical protein
MDIGVKSQGSGGRNDTRGARGDVAASGVFGGMDHTQQDYGG